MFDPTGLQLLDTVAHPAVSQTQILDYSGGQYPLTTQWLQGFFGGAVVAATPSNPAPTRGPQTTGVVVVLGRDFPLRFLGPCRAQRPATTTSLHSRHPPA